MKDVVNRLKICKKRDILVVGDVILDEYVNCNAERISSEAPVPVVRELNSEYCVGGAGNVAINCVEIGFKTTMITMVRESDFAGEMVISLLRNAKMPVGGIIKTSDRKTSHKKRIVAKNQQLLCLDSEDTMPLSACEFRLACEKLDLFLKPGMIVLLSDYDRGFVSPDFAEYVIKRAKDLGCIVLVDPSGPDYAKYRGATYIKPNLKEFNEMVDVFNLDSSDSVVANGIKICKKLECEGLFVTMGEKGIQYVSADCQVSAPTQVREIYGLAGAGDTVFAYLALGLSCDLKIDLCLTLANRAAALAISHVKTYAVGLDELVDKKIEFSEKIFTEWSHLKIELDWQSLGTRTVVFTSGCFDILHAGHVHILKEAKKFGDILVVGLNSDESVKMLDKGCDRPINSFVNRANVIAGLGMVDFVVKFDQSSPKALLEYLKPDFFVKGGDYSSMNKNNSEGLSKKFIEECEVVKSYGGAVKIVELIPGLSTTDIIKKITGFQI